MPGVDIYEIRKRRLQQLVDEVQAEIGGTRGGMAELAKRCDTDANHISNLLSEHATRNIGSKLARKIEEGAGKPRHWMDALETPAPGIPYGSADGLPPDVAQVVQKIPPLPHLSWERFRAITESEGDLMGLPERLKSEGIPFTDALPSGAFVLDISGETLIVDSTTEAGPDQRSIIWVDGEGAICRKIVHEGSKIYLISPNLPPIDATDRKHKILGRVLKRIVDE